MSLRGVLLLGGGEIRSIRLTNKTEKKVGGRGGTDWPGWKWLTQAGFTEFS